MQLVDLHIKENGILKNFTLDFLKKSNNNISVFIGENGSGKTTVLESIIKIFSWFIKNEKPAFEFELNYIVRLDETIKESSAFISSTTDYILVKLFSNNDIVDIECNIGDVFIKGIKSIKSNKLLSSIKQSIKNNKYKLLPDSIAIYYAGESTNIKKIVEAHNDEFSEAIRELYNEEKETIPRTFFYYEPFHFNLLFLALLSFEYGNIPKLLRKKIQFNKIHYFAINLKKPYWAKGKLNPENDEYWGAKGTIAVFLRQIIELSARQRQIKNGIVLHFEGEKRHNLYKLKDLYGTEKDFFTILEMTWLNDLIESVDISITRYANSEFYHVNSNTLSEGEKQALIILGLNELVLKENSLVLYDEPDTYLHPQWQRDFINELESYINNSINIKNYYIITSHSPNIVAGIKKENLFVFKNGQTKEIPFNCFGKNVESLLIDFFNVEGIRNIYVENLLKEIQDKVKRKKIESSEFKNKFQELKDILSPTAPEIVNINLEIAKIRNK
ncbi:MAG: AAA family ATPase [Bacteroidales bacterium]|jgi:predicted ATP-dependent endonuclease of OLD family|nr:AAA family ATPase [Bacteroidales bacterium]